MMMKREVTVLLSLPASRESNPYQAILENDARELAKREGFHLIVHYANRDPEAQKACMDLLIKQKEAEAIVCMPTDEIRIRPKVAEVVQAGIPFWMLNRNPDYLERIREASPDVPVAVVTPDQELVGRIQGQQIVQILGLEGDVLQFRAAATNLSSRLRGAGMQSFLDECQLKSKAQNGGKSKFKIIVSPINGEWNSPTAYEEALRWQKILQDQNATAVQAAKAKSGKMDRADSPIFLGRPDLIVLQSEAMCTGVRQALEKFAEEFNDPSIARIPMIGVDGTPEFVKRMETGEVLATITLPPTSGAAISAALEWLTTSKRPQPLTVFEPKSFPSLEQISPLRKQAGAA